MARKSQFIIKACKDCSYRFIIPSRRNTKKAPYCPSCGDNFDIVDVKRIFMEDWTTGVGIKYTNYTQEEDDILVYMKIHGSTNQEVADELGRTYHSIRRRWMRIRPANYKELMKDNSGVLQ